MDRYSARMNLRGSTQRERELNMLKSDIVRKAPSSLSYKDVKLNGEPTQLMINTSTKPYYKEFQSLPDQTVLAGDYVEWANSVWLVLNADCDDEVYTDGNLRQCQHKIFWQKDDGTIVSRYAYTENASAYNNGEKGNNTITLQSNQFMVYLPYDDETAELDNGKRVHVSRSNGKCRPYELTRPDDITYGFGEKGIFNIIFTQTQYNPDEDKLVTLEDGTQAWICDYNDHSSTSSPDTSNYSIKIEYSGNPTVVAGPQGKVFSARIYDTHEDEISSPVSWQLTCLKENEDYVSSKILENNSIRIKSKYSQDIIGTKILLQAIYLNKTEQLYVTIGGGI